MVSRKEWYERTEATWPAAVPPLGNDEAVRAVKKLYRWVRGRPLAEKVRIATGSHSTGFGYERGTGERVLWVNPERHWQGLGRVTDAGWKDVVHLLSHSLGGGHSKVHARLEASMIRQVLKRGWLSGSLKDKPKVVRPPEDPKLVKYRSVVARLASWTAKKKRADRAIAKLTRSKKYYDRIGIAA